VDWYVFLELNYTHAAVVWFIPHNIFLSQKAQRMEQLARDKEEKFSEERKNADRKVELSDLIRNILGEERKVRKCSIYNAGYSAIASHIIL
jgi:hypothetical protein